MAFFDKIFKFITGIFPDSLAGLALGTSKVKILGKLNTEHVALRMHHSDMTFHVQLPDEEAILHIEAQTDDSTHKPMHLRMLAYSSLLALEHGKNVYSTVFYLRPPAGKNDTGVYRYGNEQRGGVTFQYNVIRVYELPGEAFLDPAAVGLLPFTALMEPPADMTPKAWVEKCIETTQAADVSREMRANLLFALSLFGSLVHPKELFQDPRLEAIMQESPFYEQVMQRGIAQGDEQGYQRGITQGEFRTKQDDVIKLLTHQFPETSDTVVEEIREIKEFSRLDTLFDQILTAKTFEDIDFNGNSNQ